MWFLLFEELVTYLTIYRIGVLLKPNRRTSTVRIQVASTQATDT